MGNRQLRSCPRNSERGRAVALRVVMKAGAEVRSAVCVLHLATGLVHGPRGPERISGNSRGQEPLTSQAYKDPKKPGQRLKKKTPEGAAGKKNSRESPHAGPPNAPTNDAERAGTATGGGGATSPPKHARGRGGASATASAGRDAKARLHPAFIAMRGNSALSRARTAPRNCGGLAPISYVCVCERDRYV